MDRPIFIALRCKIQKQKTLRPRQDVFTVHVVQVLIRDTQSRETQHWETKYDEHIGDRKLTIKAPYNGTVIIVPFRSGSCEKIEVYFDFRRFVKKEHRKFVVGYLKAEGFVEKAILG